MTQQERLGLARELTGRLLARHGEGALVAVGVHGPAARGGAGDEAFLAAAGYDLVQLLSWEARARAAELRGDLAATATAVKESAVLAALVVGLLARTPYRDLAHALRATATTGAVPGSFTADYRRLLDPAAAPATQVLALGRATAALAAAARDAGVPFEAADLDAFLG